MASVHSGVFDEIKVGGVTVMSERWTAVTLTDAEIKALPTTPTQLVAAPGSGYLLQLIKADLIFKASATAYTNINVNSFIWIDEIGTGTSAEADGIVNDDTVGVTEISNILGSTGGQMFTMVAPYQDNRGDADLWGPLGYVVPTSTRSNKALNLKMDKGGSGNLTGGNSGNRLLVLTRYQLILLP